MSVLSIEETAELNDYDAIQLGLPRHVDATLILTVEGRPESERFLVGTAFRPRAHARPWSNVTLDECFITVGGKSYRLNHFQLYAMRMAERLQQADLSGRLAAWPDLIKLMHTPRWARLEVGGYLPNLIVHEAASARLTLYNKKILPIPLTAMRRAQNRCFVKHEGKLMPWSECYNHGYIPGVLQALRRSYVCLSAELVDTLTLLHQATAEGAFTNATEAFQAAQEALPASHRHLIVTA